MTYDLEFLIDSRSLHPDGVSGSELADLLRDLESAIEAEDALTTDSGTTVLAQTEGVPVVSLVNVRDGSAGYGLRYGPGAAAPAGRIMRGLSQRGWAWASVALPAQERVSRAIRRFTKRGLEVRLNSSVSDIPSVEFGPRNPPPEIDKAYFVSAPATRSVEVMKAGGVRPAATVKLVGEGYRVPVHGSKKLIQELGRKLYHRIVITGDALWRLSDWRLISFDVRKIEEYPHGDVEEVIAELLLKSDDEWGEGNCVDAFMAKMRSDDEDAE